MTPIDPCAAYRQRLERWASVLERNPDERLWLHRNLELPSPEARRLMAVRLSRLRQRLGSLPPALELLAPGRITALTLAARDPVLWRSGLASERYAAARRFFGLTNLEMHHILCFCAYGHETQVPARAIVERIRAIAMPPVTLPSG